MGLLKDSSGKLFTLNGKLIVPSKYIGPYAFSSAVLTLPWGDQVVAYIDGDSRDGELQISSDLCIDFIWQHNTTRGSASMHWGHDVGAEYLCSPDGVETQKLHIFEFDVYDWRGIPDWDSVFGESVDEAIFIYNFGRYLGTISLTTVDGATHWLIENAYNEIANGF